ncbi:arsenite methyltransferase [Patescibacteria group bacterium]|nr:arsenite methyltransferase [Patescibacteria group bacterium]
MTEPKDIKKIVKQKYSQIAQSGCGCGCSASQDNSEAIAKSIGYSDQDLAKAGKTNLGLGCGNPVAFSRIKEGDTVLDLGSGAGVDCLLAAEKVGESGKVIGVDMTEEMVKLARAAVQEKGLSNVEIILADIEQLPLPDDSVDIIISNCVINLAPDKAKVFQEAKRVLKPGGRMFVSDIVLLAELTAEQRSNEELLAGCVGGALLKEEYLAIVKQVGLKTKVLSENKDISKQQYGGIALESLLLEAEK